MTFRLLENHLARCIKMQKYSGDLIILFLGSCSWESIQAKRETINMQILIPILFRVTRTAWEWKNLAADLTLLPPCGRPLNFSELVNGDHRWTHGIV